MLTIKGSGRVTADLTVQESSKGNKFLKFGLAVNNGFGDNQKTVFLQCWVYGEKEIQRMINAKVQKGSLIYFAGDFDIDEYEKKDGTKEKIAKVTLYDWNYVPSSGKAKDETTVQAIQSTTDETAGSSDEDMPF